MLESNATFLPQSGGGEKSGAVGLLAINATKPEIMKAILWIEIAGAFAVGDPAIPFFHHEVGAAEQVVTACVVGRLMHLLLQHLHGFIDMA